MPYTPASRARFVYQSYPLLVSPARQDTEGLVTLRCLTDEPDMRKADAFRARPPRLGNAHFPISQAANFACAAGFTCVVLVTTSTNNADMTQGVAVRTSGLQPGGETVAHRPRAICRRSGPPDGAGTPARSEAWPGCSALAARRLRGSNRHIIGKGQAQGRGTRNVNDPGNCNRT